MAELKGIYSLFVTVHNPMASLSGQRSSAISFAFMQPQRLVATSLMMYRISVSNIKRMISRTVSVLTTQHTGAKMYKLRLTPTFNALPKSQTRTNRKTIKLYFWWNRVATSSLMTSNTIHSHLTMKTPFLRKLDHQLTSSTLSLSCTPEKMNDDHHFWNKLSR